MDQLQILLQSSLLEDVLSFVAGETYPTLFQHLLGQCMSGLQQMDREEDLDFELYFLHPIMVLM